MNAMGWAAPLVLLVAGCGGFEQETYDVELDAAQAAAVPYSCTDKTAKEPVAVPGIGGVSGLALQQRWTVRAEEYGATSIEVPDVSFTLHRGDVATLDEDDAPDILQGTRSDEGPFQYVDIRSIPSTVAGESNIVYVLRFYIANDSLEDDDIEGFIDVRRTSFEGLGIDARELEECTYKVRLAGRRVK
ncbi:hypothetical protein VZQ01_16000 [Myxococcus faecalis]|uniref:hypothetical protein n=1 Tax=Myxococcus TaxID=32 RepID=UPI0011421608|nr:MULTISPECIES: hypothetical protein [unclassified Myxococcus]MBZ4395692.1 hypothetical protein [Myxococcus sp. AS-1-15]MBZ4411305.1 hypothetical protein [Myxococcus sp. XM-1-1-1]BDT31049.1 hypothetical protein MFMH1_07180 [Myxococcus sp. MH1]